MYDPVYAVFQLIRDRQGDTTTEQFYDWVHNTVLPCILDTGGYLLSEECREEAGTSEIDAMPLPPAGKEFLELHGRLAELKDQWGGDWVADPSSQGNVPAYDEGFFQRVRVLGDHPAVRDLNAHIDAVVLPALFALPGAIDRLPAILEAAEMDGGVLDI